MLITDIVRFIFAQWGEVEQISGVKISQQHLDGLPRNLVFDVDV